MAGGKQEALSVLLIEDTQYDRRLAEFALTQAATESGPRYDVVPVATLAEGLAHLDGATRSPDVVLLDLGLPDATGLEALRAVRNTNPHLPIVVFTGLADVETATHALKQGASDCLEKDDISPHTLARAIRYSIERKRNEVELIRLAQSDPLTGLLNRRAFFEHLEHAISQARRSERPCAVVMFDIDRFKEINDVFGHKTGDDLLVAIARTLRDHLRTTDSIARIGGDEFAIVATNLRSANGALEIGEKIVQAVQAIRHINDMSVNIRISVGISVYPMDNADAEGLVSHADMAMYKSKAGKKGSVFFFDARMDEQVKQRHALKQRMRGDITDGRFFLAFQPIVDAQNHELVGVEGLARWRGDNGLILPPDQFIPIAEESGAIGSLGNRLAEFACGYVRSRAKQRKPIVPISLNISSIQCRDPAFGLQFLAILERYEIPCNAINIEITESVLIQNIELIQGNLAMLKDAGVGIHLDDFGTGYSSLSILKDLSPHALKIDRSFVSDICPDSKSLSIVHALVDLSKKLKFATIAEGVETATQAAILRDVGVTHLQGFHFSRPIESDVLTDWLDHHKTFRAA